MRRIERRGRAGVWLLVFVSAGALKAQTPRPEVSGAIQALRNASGAEIESRISTTTGLATFVALAKSNPVTVAGGTPEAVGQAFLSTYGLAFGISNPPSELVLTSSSAPDTLGMRHLRYQQVRFQVPVTGAELTVHMQGNRVTAVNARMVPDLQNLTVAPTLTAAAASAAVQAYLQKHQSLTGLTFSQPRLEIFDRGVLEGGFRYPVRPAWFVEATAAAVREFTWVDAETGGILLNFSQLPDAKNRRVYNAGNTNALPPDPGAVLVRSEGGPATGDLDADRAYDYAGNTYDYYLTQHGRDSLNNAGLTLDSVVHYCRTTCPYQNASWNGSLMLYGEGFSRADDVVAHELTHGVTQYSANLFYYYQSGALNESFSDIFGETVDLTNGAGTDTPAVRWQIGEDLPIGAIRNMMNPNAFGDPGRIGDPFFVCNGGPSEPNADNGGVHTNSGVPNHAYALMVDGGTYNGFTVTGIGLTKAGKIQYRALTVYLNSASDFLDNYNALNQSCTDLVGTAGITAADCTQVKNALDAV